MNSKPEKKKVGIDWPVGTQITYGCEIHNQICEEWEKFHKQAVKEELEKAHIQSEQKECSWFKGKPTAWRTEHESIREHFERIEKRIEQLKQGAEDE